MIAPDHEDEHLSDEALGAFADGALASDAKDRATAHLAECRICRAELLEVRRLRQTVPTAPDRRPMYVAGALAAAAVLLLVVGRAPEPVAVPPEHVRSVEPDRTEGVARLQVEQPGDDALVARNELAFAWHSRGEDASYRLLLTTSDGDPLWETTTRDTVLQLPADVVLSPGASYYWIVDVLDRTGRIASSGARRFSIRR